MSWSLLDMVFLFLIVITTILIIIARLLRDVEKSLYKIAKHFEQIDEKDKD